VARPGKTKLTSLFVIIRIFANPLSNVFQKKLTGNAANPLFIILVTHGLLSLMALPVLLAQLPLRLGLAFWGNISLSALLAVAGNALIVAALSSTDLSVLGPINAYKSVVSLVLGIFMLGELPTALGLVGILLIIAGSYFIIDREPGQGRRNIFWLFFNHQGIRLRFAALVLSATEAIFLKKALLVSSPLVTFLFWCLLGAPIAFLAAVWLLKLDFKPQISALRPNRTYFLLVATTTGLMQLTTLLTFGALQVSYSLALFQTSALLSVFFGYQFFQEQNLFRRMLGALIMMAGAIFIITFGAHA
jgi:drug/metabolite transporter (DMT)-like permease